VEGRPRAPATRDDAGFPGRKGGWVMWVVLAVGVVAVALLAWSVLATNHPRGHRVHRTDGQRLKREGAGCALDQAKENLRIA